MDEQQWCYELALDRGADASFVLFEDGSSTCTLLHASGRYEGLPLDYMPDTGYIPPEDNPLAVIGFFILIIGITVLWRAIRRDR